MFEGWPFIKGTSSNPQQVTDNFPSRLPTKTISMFLNITHTYCFNFRRPKHWTDFVWYNQNYVTTIKKSPIPEEFLIGKGSTHIAATRAFIDYVLHNKTAQDILQWMKDIRAPDEHYFATLNHNPQKGVPGSYTGKSIH